LISHRDTKELRERKGRYIFAERFGSVRRWGGEIFIAWSCGCGVDQATRKIWQIFMP